MVGGGGGSHFIRAGGEARRGGECVTVQAVGRRVEAQACVTLRGGVREIAQLRPRERQRAEAFAVVHRGASGRGERLRRVAVAVQGVSRAAAGVVRWAEGANLEG